MNTVYGLSYQSYSLDEDIRSVTLDILNDYLDNSTSAESFFQDNYIIIKSVNNDHEFIVIDPETGLVRDINTLKNIYGATIPYIKSLECIFASSDPHIGYWTLWPMNYGVYNFYWDGTGKVLLASTGYLNFDTSTDQIWTIGKLVVTGLAGSVTFNSADPIGQVFGPDLDITSIFKPNAINSLNFTFYPSPDDRYRSSSLYVVQTTLNNIGYHMFNSGNGGSGDGGSGSGDGGPSITKLRKILGDGTGLGGLTGDTNLDTMNNAYDSQGGQSIRMWLVDQLVGNMQEQAGSILAGIGEEGGPIAEDVVKIGITSLTMMFLRL